MRGWPSQTLLPLVHTEEISQDIWRARPSIRRTLDRPADHLPGPVGHSRGGRRVRAAGGPEPGPPHAAIWTTPPPGTTTDPPAPVTSPHRADDNDTRCPGGS